MGMKFADNEEPTIKQQAFMLTLAAQHGFQTIEGIYPVLVETCERMGDLHPSTYAAQLLKASKERGASQITKYDAVRIISLLRLLPPLREAGRADYNAILQSLLPSNVVDLAAERRHVVLEAAPRTSAVERR